MAVASLLIVPSIRLEYAQFDNLPIELLFRDEVLNMRNAKGHGLVFENPTINSLVVNGKNINSNQLGLPLNSVVENLNGLKKLVSGKAVFARDIVPTLDSAEFENFQILFDLFLAIIERKRN